MMMLMFGISASPLVANMATRRNALDYQRNIPLAAQAIMESLYIDNRLDGTHSVEEVIKPLTEMQDLFELGGFVLRKWKSSEPVVIAKIPH